MVCDICGARTYGVFRAVAAGWIPEYYEAGADGETCKPVCPACVESHLEWDDESGAFVRVTD